MTTKKNRADKEPTKTSIVLACLVTADDFITASQLIERLAGKANPNQVSASLHHLKKRHAIDCMESDGKLWWYSTPELDDRSKIVEEKVVETSPRRTRGSFPARPDGTKVVQIGTGKDNALKQTMREANEIADRIRSKKQGA
jgi:hypothetical protein